MSALQEMSKVLPYKLTKRISKTGEGRSGLEIYKRRNRRSYRGLMQYGTWKTIVESNVTPNVLDEYCEGFIVMIEPKEYFGDNYPERSENLREDFKLNEIGFVYYSNPEEYRKYRPLDEWIELCELNTTGSINGKKTWIGHYCLNIKNANPQRISPICALKNTAEDQTKLISVLENMQVDFDKHKFPSQCGIGNYDYDYASPTTIENVKLQMLYLALTSEDSKGRSFMEYIRDNYDSVKDNKDTAAFTNAVSSPNYETLFNDFFAKLEKECNDKGLLDFSKLEAKNAWNSILGRPTCPLCSKPLFPKDFFEEVEQAEGRKVQDNTQRAVVLMHIDALRPGKLNHKPYNLGWGHNFCNAIQGDKDIEATIKELKDIVKTYEENVKRGKNNDKK